MTHNEDEKILTAFRAVHQLHRDISLILMDTDRFTNGIGWTLFKNKNQCHGESTAIIDGSSKWMPRRFFRIYENESFSNLLIYLSVIIDGEQNEQNFEKPLISVGIIDYGKGSKIDNWDWDYPHAANWNDDEPIEFGQWHKVEKTGFPTNDHKAETISYFSHPLTAISGAKELTANLHEPLVEKLNEYIS